MSLYLVYITNMLLSTAPSVVNNSDVMSLSDWLLLSHLSVLTTATSSLWVSWCPVHITAAPVSPSCGHTYCVELEAAWSRPLHHMNSTGFQSLRGISVKVVFTITQLLHNSPRYLPHSYWPQSLTFRRDLHFDRRETVTLTFHDRDERSTRDLFALPHC